MKACTTIVIALATALLSACGREPTSPDAAPSPVPTDGFQKLIYDSQGFSVLRDRQTGCQWIAVLVADRAAEDMVPRTAVSRNGRVDQLCTSDSDPLSKPLKVVGEHGLFQEFGRSDLGRDMEIRLYRDVETGCEWILTYTYTDSLRLIMRPRTARRADEVEQVCRPIARR
jgi:hypothetical protein